MGLCPLWSFSPALPHPRLLRRAVGEAGAGHALADATLLDEVLLQPQEEAAEEAVGNLDEADEHVGADGGVGVLDALLEGLVVGAGLTAQGREPFGVGVVLGPFLDAAGAQKAR